MSAESLKHYFAERLDDPAIRLLAATTAAVRADPGFVQHPEDVAGGALLSDEAPAILAADALNTVMARIDEADVLDRKAAEAAVESDRAAEIAALPSPVREVAQAALKRGSWRFGGFGIRRLPLLVGKGGFAELMRIEPGRGVVDHDHAADELTLVLTGGYNDGHAHYAPGDISLARPGLVHDPKADPGEVCYVLAVSYGPPRFSGVFRLLQWLGSPPCAPAASSV
jgi:putative transcriptional regulator